MATDEFVLEAENLETKQEYNRDADIRGKSFSIVKDGNIILSGSIPSKADLNDKMSKLGYYIDLSNNADADLYLGQTNTKSLGNFTEPKIIGTKTWSDVQAVQMGKFVGTGLKAKMPENSILIYSSNEHFKKYKLV